MEKKNIKINDFNMLYEIVKSLSKMSDGVKFSINDCGLEVFAKNSYAKCELTSNTVSSTDKIEFCIGDLNMLLKILSTVRSLYDDSSICDVKLYFDHPFLKIESKKFKTKISVTEEQRIANFLGTKVHTQLNPSIEFTTNSELIKSVNSHSYIFNDSSVARIYLSTDSEMENNMIFATIGSEDNELANSVTLELGMINFGTMGDRKVILDFNRLNILNMVSSDEIKVSIDSKYPVVSTNIRKTGKNDSFFNINIYSFMMVK